MGFTGHQRLADETLWGWVESELHSFLSQYRPDTGACSLAVGSDQLFGRVLLDHDINLVVVKPFPDYERTFTGDDLAEYRRLLAVASRVVELPGVGTDEQSYMEAGRWIVRHSDEVVAVWNGKPAEGLGGTADIVAHALASSIPVWHIDTSSHKTVELPAA